MPTVFTHAVVGLSGGLAVSNKISGKRLWVLSTVCAVLPDADVIGYRLGIPYSHFFGHRGFFHSICFAFLVGLATALIFFGKEGYFSKKWWYWWLYFSLLTTSHGILDAFTNGGLGIALLSPFDNERYFFWKTPILVSPIGARAFFTKRGLAVLVNEFRWVWIPALILGGLGKFCSLRKKPAYNT